MFNIVVVLYGVTYQESTTVNSLKHLLSKKSYPELAEIILFDNSPKTYCPNDLPAQFTYMHSEENVGLAKAYNYALNFSKDKIDWLITFDQDTVVTAEYLALMIENQKQVSDTIVAIAPIIQNGEQQISPVSSNTLRPLKEKKIAPNQIYLQNIMVINSGTAVKVEFLKEINGYNEEFPLDYLDHWLSWEIFAEGKEIEIIDTDLQHDLSVLNYQQVSLVRYQSILNAETKYFSKYQTKLAKTYSKQLLLRVMKHLIKGRFSFAKLTFRYFLIFLEEVNGSRSTASIETKKSKKK
ncbi:MULTISPECIES: glycosyltransferase [Enterococcus]|uniref:Glycosyltransferase n=1 Tax=Enterococcus alishanensis TaxID=1303817 RepID=A0ABS6TAC5_9ENTE|nr:glycosyltransferase [Enterococcus alishanensis]MBV7389849.1 glycosyltransferase [Enterococcus alishanensis]